MIMAFAIGKIILFKVIVWAQYFVAFGAVKALVIIHSMLIDNLSLIFDYVIPQGEKFYP